MEKETRQAIRQEIERQIKRIEEKILTAKETQERANKAIIELNQKHLESLREGKE